MRRYDDADGLTPPSTWKAGPLCNASRCRSSSTCRFVDTTSSSLLALLAPRPGATVEISHSRTTSNSLALATNAFINGLLVAFPARIDN